MFDKLEAALKESEELDVKNEEQEDAPLVDEEEDVKADPEPEEAEKEEDVKADDEAEEEEEPNNSDWARMRRKMKDESKKRESMEKALESIGVTQQQMVELIAQQNKPVVKQEVREEIPDAELYPDEHNKYRLDKMELENQELRQQLSGVFKQQQAQETRVETERLYQQIEDEFAADVPDYKEAKEHITKTYRAAIKLSNPQISEYNLKKQLKNIEIETAADLAKNGINPAEHFYEQAIEIGYTPQDSKEDNPKPKRSLNEIRRAKNRTKSTIVGGSSSSNSKIKLPKNLFEQMNMSKSDRDKAYNS